MNLFTLILENSWRDLKEGDGRISMATQTALLFFLLTLTLTSASIQGYLADNLDQMLGSDLVLESHAPMTGDDEAAFRSLAPRQSVTQLSDITLTHNDEWARVRLKRVDDAYPLQGQLQVQHLVADGHAHAQRLVAACRLETTQRQVLQREVVARQIG